MVHNTVSAPCSRSLLLYYKTCLSVIRSLENALFHHFHPLALFLQCHIYEYSAHDKIDTHESQNRIQIELEILEEFSIVDVLTLTIH